MPEIINKADSKHLSFRLSSENYAVEILKVREIIGLMEITAVPKTASHVRGVINLRGKIVPVLDMRQKFGLPQAGLKRENCIITVMAEGGEGQLLVGILVDAVNEVLQLDQAQIEPMPSLGNDMRLDAIKGLAKIQDKVVILLDIDKVVLSEDLKELGSLALEATHA